MEAWIEGQKATATVIKPVVVNLTMQHVVERPRRKGRYEDPKAMTWPPSCPYADDYIKSVKEVACLKIQDWISLERCWRCFLGWPV